MTARRFCLSFLLALGVMASGVVVINYFVDPYGIHGMPTRQGFNEIKPAGPSNGDLIKPYQVQTVKPRTLVLGSSRAEAALDPDSSLWPASSRPIYNMALPATGVVTALRSLRHVLKTHKPDTVFLGLEFFEFVVDQRTPQPAGEAGPDISDFRKRLLVDDAGAPNADYALQQAKDRFFSLLSINALSDSIETVARQRMADQPHLTPLGFNPMNQFRGFVKVDGHDTIFRQVNTTYLGNYMRSSKRIFVAGTTTSPEFEALRQLIRLCNASGIRLVIFIHPYHAHMLEDFRLSGLWEPFESWKREVVKLLDTEDWSHADPRGITLWDFSGYNDVTTERVPTASERGMAMQWYWEAGHYKREAGEIALRRMLELNPIPGDPVNFGVKLSTTNIETQLNSIRSSRELYVSQRADEMESLRRIAAALSEKTQTHKQTTH